MHLLVLLAGPLLCHLVLTAVLAAFLGTFAGLLLAGILLVVHGVAPAGNRPTRSTHARRMSVMRWSGRRERRVQGRVRLKPARTRVGHIPVLLVLRVHQRGQQCTRYRGVPLGTLQRAPIDGMNVGGPWHVLPWSMR